MVQTAPSGGAHRRISLVMPVYNEAANIERAYAEILSVFTTLPYDLEFVFTDNHSEDDTFAILARLALGEATVLELAKPFQMSQPAVSRHLKVLETAGLIEQRVDGTRRPRRLAKPALDNIDQFLNMLRQALAANYDRLDQVLAEMNTPQGDSK